MRPRRFLLAFVVALGLAPGTFLRSELPAWDNTSPVLFQQLAVGNSRTGALTLAGAWQLSSKNDWFGGFSALVPISDTEFLAASDAGRAMRFTRPDRGNMEPRLDPFLWTRKIDKMEVDIEAMTHDPATGRIWASLEWARSIIGFDANLGQPDRIRPREMAEWKGNFGPESLVRLRDGRFIAIKEGSLGEGRHEALLFAGDPLEGASAERFTFHAREGFRPADAALLPDGRIAVLLRGFELGLPPRFPGMIVVSDPAEIEPGGTLQSMVLARLDAPLPSDNFEGIAVTIEGDKAWALWVISDDNFAGHQRTLLLKLRWENPPQSARQKARG